MQYNHSLVKPNVEELFLYVVSLIEDKKSQRKLSFSAARSVLRSVFSQSKLGLLPS